MTLDVEKIEARRKRLGLSQDQAADKADIKGGKQRWSNIIHGTDGGITLTTLGKIAKALGLKAKDLLK